MDATFVTDRKFQVTLAKETKVEVEVKRSGCILLYSKETSKSYLPFCAVTFLIAVAAGGFVVAIRICPLPAPGSELSSPTCCLLSAGVGARVVLGLTLPLELEPPLACCLPEASRATGIGERRRRLLVSALELVAISSK